MSGRGAHVVGNESFTSSQPDLRQIVAEVLQRQVEAESQRPPGQLPPPEHRLIQAPSAGDITIRCQRTWRAIQTVNPRLNGGDFSAVVVQFEQRGNLFSYFVEVVRQKGSDTWGPAGFSGGKMPESRRNQAGGFMLAGGSHVCVGGLRAVPDGGSIRVTLADGSSYESTATDGCCIVLAPVTSPPSHDDHVTVQYLNPDGSEIAANRVWMGDGKPPRRSGH